MAHTEFKINVLEEKKKTAKENHKFQVWVS